MRVEIMVAGGAGFIGSALVRTLLEEGHRVTVLDDFSCGSRENLNEVADRIEIVTCDAAEPASLSAAIIRVRPTHVISCIGDTYVPAAYAFPERFIRNNVVANLNLLQSCRRAGVAKFLYLSSAEVYGSQPRAILSETSALGAVNTYAVSKLAADQLMMTCGAEHDVSTCVARMFNCYGPRETHAYIVPEIIDQLHRSSELALGDISAIRDLTYVEDSARALLRLLLADTKPGLAVNIGSGRAVSVADLARMIGHAMGYDTISFTTRSDKIRRNEIKAIRCDNRLLRSLTGWAPAVPLEEGLERTVAWFRANGGRWPWRSHEDEVSTHAAVTALRAQTG